MEEVKDKKKLGIIIGIVVFIILIILFLVLVVFKKEDQQEYEAKQVVVYSDKMSDVMDKVKEMKDVEEAKAFVVS